MTPASSPSPVERALTAIENALQNPQVFTTEELITDLQALLDLAGEYLQELPVEQQELLGQARDAMAKKDRKRLLRDASDVVNICRDAWQQARLRYYNEVKRYLKFIHENRRTPTRAESRAIQLKPDKLDQYQSDLDRFLQEGEGPEDFGPAEEGEQPEKREDFIAKEAERVITEWGGEKHPVSIPALVIEGGYSFSDAIAIAQWLTDHGITPENILESRLSDSIAPGTTQAHESHQCPVCGHKLPPFPTGDTSVICEGCGFEVKREE